MTSNIVTWRRSSWTSWPGTMTLASPRLPPGNLGQGRAFKTQVWESEKQGQDWALAPATEWEPCVQTLEWCQVPSFMPIPCPGLPLACPSGQLHSGLSPPSLSLPLGPPPLLGHFFPSCCCCCNADSEAAPRWALQDGAVRIGMGRFLQGGCSVNNHPVWVSMNVIHHVGLSWPFIDSLGLEPMHTYTTRVSCVMSAIPQLSADQDRAVGPCIGADRASRLPPPLHTYTPIARKTDHCV